MKADATTETAVMRILEDLGEAFASKDVQRVLGHAAPDTDIVMLGSEEGEKAIGRRELEDFLQSVYSRPMSYSLEWSWHSVSAEGSVAWVVAEGLVHAESADHRLSSPYRLTMVLVKRRDNWLMVHYHGSEPAREPMT
jgi:uncharacterized protein (TIGR02246 family)